MRYFLDTEFNEDGHTIDLISIGVVAENGREFYFANQDAELDKVNPWVREHVLPQLPPYGTKLWLPRWRIAEELKVWVGQEPPEFWGYYADYDWVVLCQMFGTMMALPPTWPKFCMDLKQLSVMKGNPKHPKQETGEHNALADARWNRDLYKYLMGLP